MTRSNKFFAPIFVSFVAFALASLLGLSMRWAFVLDFPDWFEYRNIEHAHSHLALLGWLHSMFLIGIAYCFDLTWKRYEKLFWWMQASVLGMLLTFPVVGYAPPSIACTVIHMILSYAFAYKVIQDLGSRFKNDISALFLKASLFFMVLSTLGTWALGPILAMGLKGSALYYGSIQFYLHFQFNGWFIFGLIAILFSILKKSNVNLDKKLSKSLFITLFIATLLTFALAVTWSTPYVAIFITNGIGVVIQMIALLILLKLLKDHLQLFKKSFSSYISLTFAIAILALSLKIIIQSVVVIPAIAQISYTIHNFIIGFIHLLMLGCLSLFAFGMISYIFHFALSSLGTGLFMLGVVITELLLFTQGIMLWLEWGFMPYYYTTLALGSTIISIGILIIVVDMVMNREKYSF